jgi:hypothetical protein
MKSRLEEWESGWTGFLRVAGGVEGIDLDRCTAVRIVCPVELGEMLWDIPV